MSITIQYPKQKAHRLLRAITYGIVTTALLFLSITNSYSQLQEPYDEISVTLTVSRVGSCEVPAIIHEEKACLSIKEVFDFLKIKNSISQDADSITGFFIRPDASYSIDHTHQRITFQGKV